MRSGRGANAACRGTRAAGGVGPGFFPRCFAVRCFVLRFNPASGDRRDARHHFVSGPGANP